MYRMFQTISYYFNIWNLEKLLTKGPNYIKVRSISFNKTFTEITTSLDKCIGNLINKSKCNFNNFNQWRNMILEKIDLKI